MTGFTISSGVLFVVGAAKKLNVLISGIDVKPQLAVAISTIEQIGNADENMYYTSLPD